MKKTALFAAMSVFLSLTVGCFNKEEKDSHDEDTDSNTSDDTDSDTDSDTDTDTNTDTNTDTDAWTRHIVASDLEYPPMAVAVDMDGDGDLDVLGTNKSEVIWWENSLGQGKEWTEHIVAKKVDDLYFIHAADVDGDGDTDVMSAFRGTGSDSDVGSDSDTDSDVDSDSDSDTDTGTWGEIAWYENTGKHGESWTKHSVTTEVGFTPWVYVGDLDGDKDMDVASVVRPLRELVWWENTKEYESVWPKHVVTTFSGNIEIQGCMMVIVDMDDDGHEDILNNGQNGHGLSFYKNTKGDGTSWNEHIVDETFNPDFLRVADMDGDNDVDIVASEEKDPGFAWWENSKGDGTSWLKHDMLEIDMMIGPVSPGDIDQDGDADIVFGLNKSLVWWENTESDGTIWDEHVVSQEYIRYLETADLDGDGDLDILHIDSNTEIAWLENNILP